jgi:cytochrome c oxidase cbb3-type subunit 2
MAGAIYKKPVAFAVMATVTILAGTIATMVYPMFRAEMHPKVEGLAPLPALALAGRDVYQREGCVNCHTQVVRPLKSEVARYAPGIARDDRTGKYSLAGEYAYDHPFLWGSKRTGPDLAFEGWLKPAASWHYGHFKDPQAIEPRSNMPSYAFLEQEPVDVPAVQASMRALRKLGVPYDDAAIAAAAADLAGKTHMDALVAYMLSLGRAVDRGPRVEPGTIDLATANPMSGPAAVALGKQKYEEAGCGACHDEDGRGIDGIAPSLLDDVFLAAPGDLPDAAYFAIIRGGSDVKPSLGREGDPGGGMQAYAGQLKDEEIWAIVAWLRAYRAEELREHGTTR